MITAGEASGTSNHEKYFYVVVWCFLFGVFLFVVLGFFFCGGVFFWFLGFFCFFLEGSRKCIERRKKKKKLLGSDATCFYIAIVTTW